MQVTSEEMLSFGDVDEALFAVTPTSRFVTVLESGELDEAWEECLAQLGNVPRPAREATRDAALQLREHFLGVLRDVTDVGEHEGLTAVFYALVRCHWILLNHQGGYQVSAGNVDKTVHCILGMLSAMLGRLELVLDAEDVNALSRLLAQPIRSQADPEAAPGLDPETPEETARLAREAAELRTLARRLQAERAMLEAEVANARQARRLLREHLGVSDPAAVVGKFHDLRERYEALREIQSVLGGLEETASLLNLA